MFPETVIYPNLDYKNIRFNLFKQAGHQLCIQRRSN
jgi:hypothetical protein